MYIYIYVNINRHTRIYVFVCSFQFLCLSIYACVFTYVYMYSYIYIWAFIQSPSTATQICAGRHVHVVVGGISRRIIMISALASAIAWATWGAVCGLVCDRSNWYWPLVSTHCPAVPWPTHGYHGGYHWYARAHLLHNPHASAFIRHPLQRTCARDISTLGAYCSRGIGAGGIGYRGSTYLFWWLDMFAIYKYVELVFPHTSFASSGTVDASSLAQLSVRWRQWARQAVRSLLPSRLPYVSPCSYCAVVSASSAWLAVRAALSVVVHTSSSLSWHWRDNINMCAAAG